MRRLPVRSLSLFALALPLVVLFAAEAQAPPAGGGVLPRGFPRQPPPVQPPAGLSLDALLSPPYPSAIAAAPVGGRVAWVQNDRGARNLWVADPPDYRGRAVTSWKEDDGQSVEQLEWSADAKTIYFVRGTGPNRAGDNPNPTSDPAGAEQAVWRVKVDALAGIGGGPVRIGPGTAPAASPHGEGVAFVRSGKIFWLAAEGSPAVKPAKGKKAEKPEPKAIVQTRGGSLALRFSPDGRSLAFVSARGDHAFLGVYEFAGKRVRWMAPSVDRDGQPVWSPDGRHLAFLRLPVFSRTTIFHADREAPPWSIQVADVATGQAHTVFRADTGRGSVYQEVGDVDMPNQLLWAADDRLVFAWEKDGWLHLYSLPSSGGAPALLTPGEFEAESATLTPDRRQLVFTSNQADVDRLHLWRVDVAGGKPPEAVTRGAGIEWSAQVTSDGKAVAYFASDARLPPRAVVLALGGAEGGKAEAREMAPGTMPADFPARQLVEPQPVTLTAADGLLVHGQLFLPPGGSDGRRHPAAIFFHGGSHRQMLLGWHYLGYYTKAYALNQYLASRGFVVLSVNYRSGTGYGFEFREAPRQGAEGGSEFNDVLGAGLYLRGRTDVDPERIGVWGGSYGGYLTAMALSRASHLFAAGVDMHGVHDWNSGIRNFVPDYAPTPEEERLAFQSSPMATLDGWRSPVLLIHADDDRNVSFHETVKLIEALRKRSVEVETLIIPDDIHSFLRAASWSSALHAAAEFLERKLGSGKK
jgi:dipeptidyl aminopeptidase/acylaminoacyl peptidase